MRAISLRVILDADTLQLTEAGCGCCAIQGPVVMGETPFGDEEVTLPRAHAGAVLRRLAALCLHAAEQL